MRSSAKPPATPIYVPPAPYIQPEDPQKTVPQVLTPTQVMSQGADVEAMLPQWLQLQKDPMNPEGRSAYESNYDQLYNKPTMAALESDLYNNGQAYGSYAGSLVGQQKAMGDLTKYQAGLDYAQQLFNNQITGRQSYYSGGPAVAQAQNAADVARGLGIAGLNSSNTANHNQYNMSAAQSQNGYNQQNYNNQYQAYQQKLQDDANRAQGVLGLFTGGLSLLGGGLLSRKSSSPVMSTAGSVARAPVIGDFGNGSFGRNIA